MGLRDNLSRDTVAALRHVGAVQVDPGCTIKEAIEQLQQRAVGCVVVVENSCPVGVLTERDVLRKVLDKSLPLNTPIASVMTNNPMVVREDTPIAEVMRTMDSGGFRHLPAVNGQGHLVGLVSVKQVVEYLVEHFPAAVFNLPPAPGQTQTAREGA